MEYNKRRFSKSSDRKTLHKIKKQWIVVSTAMLMAIGGGVMAARTPAHAAQLDQPTGHQPQSTGSAQPAQQKSPLSTQTGQSAVGRSIESQANRLHQHIINANLNHPRSVAAVKSRSAQRASAANQSAVQTFSPRSVTTGATQPGNAINLTYKNQTGKVVGTKTIPGETAGKTFNILNSDGGKYAPPTGYKLQLTMRPTVTFEKNSQSDLVNVIGNQITSDNDNGKNLFKLYIIQSNLHKSITRQIPITGHIGDDSIYIDPTNYLPNDYYPASDDTEIRVRINSDGTLSPTHGTFTYVKEGTNPGNLSRIDFHYQLVGSNSDVKDVYNGGPTTTSDAGNPGDPISDNYYKNRENLIPQGYYFVGLPKGEQLPKAYKNSAQSVFFNVAKDDSVVYEERIDGRNYQIGNPVWINDYGNQDPVISYQKYSQSPYMPKGFQAVSTSTPDGWSSNFQSGGRHVIQVKDTGNVGLIKLEFIDTSDNNQQVGDPQLISGQIGQSFNMNHYIKDVPSGYKYTNPGSVVSSFEKIPQTAQMDVAAESNPVPTPQPSDNPQSDSETVLYYDVNAEHDVGAQRQIGGTNGQKLDLSAVESSNMLPQGYVLAHQAPSLSAASSSDFESGGVITILVKKGSPKQPSDSDVSGQGTVNYIYEDQGRAIGNYADHGKIGTSFSNSDVAKAHLPNGYTYQSISSGSMYKTYPQNPENIFVAVKKNNAPTPPDNDPSDNEHTSHGKAVFYIEYEDYINGKQRVNAKQSSSDVITKGGLVKGTGTGGTQLDYYKYTIDDPGTLPDGYQFYQFDDQSHDTNIKGGDKNIIYVVPNGSVHLFFNYQGHDRGSDWITGKSGTPFKVSDYENAKYNMPAGFTPGKVTAYLRDPQHHGKQEQSISDFTDPWQTVDVDLVKKSNNNNGGGHNSNNNNGGHGSDVSAKILYEADDNNNQIVATQQLSGQAGSQINYQSDFTNTSKQQNPQLQNYSFDKLGNHDQTLQKGDSDVVYVKGKPVKMTINYVDSANHSSVLRKASVPGDYGKSFNVHSYFGSSNYGVPSGYQDPQVISSNVPQTFASGGQVTVAVTKSSASAKILYEADDNNNQLVATQSLNGKSGSQINYQDEMAKVPQLQNYSFDKLGNHDQTLQNGDSDVVYVKGKPVTTNILYVGPNYSVQNTLSVPGDYGTPFILSKYLSKGMPKGYKFDRVLSNDVPKTFVGDDSVIVGVTNGSKEVSAKILYEADDNNNQLVATQPLNGKAGSQINYQSEMTKVPQLQNYSFDKLGNHDRTLQNGDNDVVYVKGKLVKMTITYVDSANHSSVLRNATVHGDYETPFAIGDYLDSSSDGIPSDYEDPQKVTNVPQTFTPNGEMTIAVTKKRGTLNLVYSSNGRFVGNYSDTQPVGTNFDLASLVDAHVPSGYQNPQITSGQNDDVYTSGTETVNVNVKPIPKDVNVSLVYKADDNGDRTVYTMPLVGLPGTHVDYAKAENDVGKVQGLRNYSFDKLGRHDSVMKKGDRDVIYVKGKPVTTNILYVDSNYSVQSNLPVPGDYGTPFILNDYLSEGMPKGYEFDRIISNDVPKTFVGNNSVIVGVKRNASDVAQGSVQFTYLCNGQTAGQYEAHGKLGTTFDPVALAAEHVPFGYEDPQIENAGVDRFTKKPATVMVNVKQDPQVQTVSAELLFKDVDNHDAVVFQEPIVGIAGSPIDYDQYINTMSNVTKLNKYQYDYLAKDNDPVFRSGDNDVIYVNEKGHRNPQHQVNVNIVYVTGNNQVMNSVEVPGISGQTFDLTKYLNKGMPVGYKFIGIIGGTAPSTFEDDENVMVKVAPIAQPSDNNQPQPKPTPQPSSSAAQPNSNPSTPQSSSSNSASQPSNNVPASQSSSNSSNGPATQPSSSSSTPQSSNSNSASQPDSDSGSASQPNSQSSDGQTSNSSNSANSNNHSPANGDQHSPSSGSQQSTGSTTNRHSPAGGNSGTTASAGGRSTNAGGYSATGSGSTGAVSGVGSSFGAETGTSANGGQLPKTGDNSRNAQIAQALTAIGSALGILGYVLERRRRHDN